MLALVVGPSTARGGERPSIRSQSIPKKPASEFKLRDEDSNDGSLQVLTGTSDDDNEDEEDKYITNAIIGIPTPRKFPTKVLSEEEQRIWSAVSCPSSLADVLQRNYEVAKAKTKVTMDAF